MAELGVSFIRLCNFAYDFAPGVNAMKGNPTYNNWAEHVVAISSREELQHFRRVLTETADDGLVTCKPLQRFTEEEGRSLPSYSYEQASRIGEAEAKTDPCTAFVLTWISLVGWVHMIRDNLYIQIDGMPSKAWAIIPTPMPLPL